MDAVRTPPMMAARESDPCECGAERVTLMVGNSPPVTWPRKNAKRQTDMLPLPTLTVTCCRECDSTTYFAAHEGCEETDRHAHGVAWMEVR